MMKDAENGKIGCIVTKDLSRFGRNAIDTGFYIEKYFPSHGIRFIAVNDGYDSAKGDAGLEVMLTNLVSEAYAIDIGRKVRAALHQQMKDGNFVGSRPPYGYLKSAGDCHKLVIDGEAAENIRLIYQLKEEGKGIPEIVRLLNSRGTLTPGRYWLQKGIADNISLAGSGRWQARTVLKILTNEVYAGTLVQRKTKAAGNKRQVTAPNGIIRIENTHSPVVSPAQYMRVKEILSEKPKNAKKPAVPYPPNLFAGKVFCAFCGGRLDRKKSPLHYVYRCTANYAEAGACTGNSIRESELIAAITYQLKQYAHNVAEAGESLPDMDPAQFELEQIQAELSSHERESVALYENLVLGNITEHEYLEEKNKHRRRAEQLGQRQKQLIFQQQDRLAAKDERKRLFESLTAFTKSGELTKGLIDRLLSRIEVHSNGMVFMEFKLFA